MNKFIEQFKRMNNFGLKGIHFPSFVSIVMNSEILKAVYITTKLFANQNKFRNSLCIQSQFL